MIPQSCQSLYSKSEITLFISGFIFFHSWMFPHFLECYLTVLKVLSWKKESSPKLEVSLKMTSLNFACLHICACICVHKCSYTIWGFFTELRKSSVKHSTICWFICHNFHCADKQRFSLWKFSLFYWFPTLIFENWNINPSWKKSNLFLSSLFCCW